MDRAAGVLGTTTLAVVAGLLVASPAAAEDRLHLTWTAPPGCPTVDAVRTAALRDAGGRAVAASTLLEADGRVERRGAAWRVTLRTRRGSAQGERQIEASTCSGVSEAATVLLALALVPPGSAPAPAPVPAAAPLALVAPIPAPAAPVAASPAAASPAAAAPPAFGGSATSTLPQGGATPGAATLSSADSAGSGEPASAAEPTASAPSAPPKESAAAPRTPAPRGPHLFALGAGASADASTLPLPTVGAAVTVAWTPSRFRAELDGRRWASQSHALATSGAGARFSMTSAAARGCWTVLRLGPVDAAPCAGASFDVVDASGFGADTNYPATARWVTITGGALVRAGLTPWLALRAVGEASVPLSRPTFVVEGQGDVHRPPTLGTTASFGAEVLFL